jgi:transposase
MNRRVEVLTGPERRRRWSDEEKLQLVAEACQPGNSVSQVARERGISASQLFGWRRQMLAKGLLTDNRSEPSVAPALTFAPVEISKEQPPPDAGGKMRSARRQAATRISGSVEIELKGGDRIRVEGCTEAGLVVRIISALKRA